MFFIYPCGEEGNGLQKVEDKSLQCSALEEGVLLLLEDWGPYGPPTYSTCGGPAGDPSGPKNFLVKKNLGQKKFWVKKFFGSKKFLGQKKFWVKIFFG